VRPTLSPELGNATPLGVICREGCGGDMADRSTAVTLFALLERVVLAAQFRGICISGEQLST